MKKHFFLVLFFSIFSLVSYNQYFTIQDIEAGRNSYLKPTDYDNLQWNNSTGNIVYSEDDTLYSMELTGNERIALINLKGIATNLLVHGLKVPEAFPVIEILPENKFSFSDSDYYCIIDLESKKLEKLFTLPSGFKNEILSPDNEFIAYMLDNNIWLQNSDGEKLMITNDTVDGIVNGDVVFRNEFGVNKWIQWSPKGNYLAFYRKDQTGVSKYPLVDYNKKPAETKFIRYPMAGTKSEETNVLIYSIHDKSIVELQINGDPEQYSTNISWTPDEKEIYIQHLNRDQNKMQLKCYNAQTGAFVEELFIEVDDRYVEPFHPLIFSLKSPGDFFYQSDRSGYNHLYYYNSKKETLERITEGDWEVTEFLGFDVSEDFIYFMATKDSPLESHCYRLNRDDKEITKLTDEEGNHEAIFNKDMTYFIDRFSNYTVSNKIQVSKNSGEVVKELLVSDNPIKDYLLGEVERGTILAADDSTELYYRLIKPTNFDPGKRYPLLIYVYAGPHVQLITNSWLDRIEYFQQYMAQHGFISFTLDPRGSDNRGKDFEDVIYRQLGIPQLADQMAGVNYLKSLPYIDTSRIGVHGWSFGGYMTISMMSKYPEVFKTGVAGGPVIDWRYYEIMYTERYMDKPSENVDGYNKTDLKNFVGKLKGDLLIIHGALDHTVVWQQSLVYLQACIDSNVVVDYFVYPGHEHNVVGKERVHLTGLIANYFIDHFSQ